MLPRLKPDAVAIELHGAMATTQFDDAEGDLLSRLRHCVGEDVPIAVGLDLHANVTDAMLSSADICTACKQNPHDDFADNGRRVAALLLRVISGQFRPTYTLAKTRMIAPGKLETAAGPLREMHDRARRLECDIPAIEDISIYNIYRFADSENMGQAAVVLSNGPVLEAEKIAGDFAQEFWARKEEFKDDLPSLDDALDSIASSTTDRVTAIGDLGDRTIAGAPGDSTLILQAAMLHSFRFSCALTVHDSETVDQAHAAGVGATLRMRLGGKLTPQFQPFNCEGVVRALNEADITIDGPIFAGESAGLGRTALVVIKERFAVIVTERPGFVLDLNLFRAHGLEIEKLDFVVMKSQYHFTTNIEGQACYKFVATPGLSYYVPGVFKKRRGFVWPDSDVSADPLAATQIFDRRR